MSTKMNIINVGYSSTNYYVLEKNKARILIDVGLPGSYPRLLANLKPHDIALQSIGHLLVTHYHPDHAGIVEEVKAEGLRLIVLEAQTEGIAFMQTYMKLDSPYIPIRLDNNIQLSISHSRSFLKSLGFDGEIITTPGHSDDSVSLILDDGSAFTGDLTLPELADDADRDAVMSSWQKIRALHATRIYTGHSSVQPVDLPV